METRQSRPARPLLDTPTLKYFIDRNGVATKRMANVSGQGHFEIMQDYLGPAAQDLYGQMARLGFARVQETEREIHVEARSLTSHQRRYLAARSQETGLELVLNSHQFVESKDVRAAGLARRLLD